MTKKQSCCFTGHRPQSLPFRFNENDERCIDLKRRLKDAIIEMITQNGVTHFISGMAIGVDMYAAEIVLELKETYPNISLEAAIPCENQSAKWAEQLRTRYNDILEKCDIRTVLQHSYTADCMHKRNKYMVDNSDWIIAVWNGKPSGTGKTVKYAEECGCNIIVILPYSKGA